ncbi:hypothetical protein [Gordonia phage GTE5]|uniref:Uncharacterized protein n=2 Tax=Gruunavirus TaxID=2948731 RepID=A0A386KA84_9CAUD|nr:hypothetical protein GoPhGTE5p61 [Gordonia phage GTE5]YP_010098777.1 hypothetical protein KNU13_gp77 [Gordonia phage Turuncu]AET09810.1 hypothetical protein [Gordonia phage GTE5]AYD82163.1 hypothetical protein SEA_TURUNCU_77 [Gordonia phage Turuncu]WAA19704.1 hypothetical protein SEA_DALILPOP_77 [Gordonia phage Dalilpop]
MKTYLIEVQETKTTTFSVRAESEQEAKNRYPEVGVPIHSEHERSEPAFVGMDEE